MEGTSTDSLRRFSTPWTLAGDEMLLKLLQNVHQNIVSKCQEVTTKLDEMTSSLDGASIDLQNVNNKFMSLSNRQFIESRVYEDDVDFATPTHTNKQEQPRPAALDELSILKNGLAIIESTHETAEIIDDSDSDSDVEISVVLKPKDVYSHRPLPYIIGSQQWREKWHAGLIIEASDSESMQSKSKSEVEYSDSEVEDLQTDLQRDHTISEGSSLHSYQEHGPEFIPAADRVLERRPPPTAAEVAANIASVMARTQPVIERPATPPSPEQYTPVKPPAVYRPTQPLTSHVFLDEPPPLDSHQYSSSSSQEDIFAEINKNIPYNQGVKVQSGISEDLFGKREKEDVFGVPYDESSSYFRDEPPKMKQKPLIKEGKESKSVEQPENISKDNIEENITKKPIGGISLFGTNKDTDTIGAAILQRNVKKPSTTDETGSDVPVRNNKKPNIAAESQNVDEIDNRKAEKDIFENLFAKSNEASNKNTKYKEKEQKTIVNTEKKHKKDLFSDNIFDDVDDIFSSDIKNPSKTNKRSLFDDDDDDLFTDIAKSNANVSKTQNTKPQTVKSNLFDSDDELFSDIKTNEKDQAEKVVSKTEHPTVNSKIESKTNKIDTDKEKVPSNTVPVEQTTSKTTQPVNTIVENKSKSKTISIFDSDSDEDIFNFNKSATKNNIEKSSAKSKLETKETKIFQSPSLFDDDEEDELFANINKNKEDPIKEVSVVHKQEPNKNYEITEEIKPKSKISGETDPLLPKNDGEYFETEIENNNVSNNKNDTLEYTSQSSNSIESTPSNSDLFTTISKNTHILDDNLKNVEEERKAPELDEIQPNSLENETASNTNEEITPIDITTKDQLEVTIDKETIAKVTLKPKPEVPIFDGHLFEDDEPPPFEPTIEPIGSIAEEKRLFDEEKKNITTQNVEIPIFYEQTENVPYIENIPPEIPGFDDIVSEPPIFEKVKEPKKSKNVNALFDDDSEDEALFFKKNDVISDEKPDVFSKPANFGLFTDEPPPADFESDLFGTKYVPESDLKDRNTESSKIDEKLNKSNEKVDFNIGKGLKTDIPKNEQLPAQSLFGNDSDDDLFSFNKASTSKSTKDNTLNFENNSKIKESDQIPAKTDTIVEQNSIFDDLDDNLFTTKTQYIENRTPDNIIIKKETDNKKVGKLTTNLNINVQALIPGASPKKTKLEKVETEPTIAKLIDTESKPIDTESKPIDTEPKMVKSVSFEEEPDTGVLDNNASKQRAKIQVKRRPSSRKARHEAVRKSALDLDQNKEQHFETNDQSTNYENNSKLDDKNIKHDSLIEKSTISYEKVDQIDQCVKTTENNTNLKSNITIDEIIQDNDQSNTNEIFNKLQIPQSQNQKTSHTVENQNEKSTKIVYVLNDEDIFTNPIKNDTASTSKSNDVFGKTEVTATKVDEKSTRFEKATPRLDENSTKVKERPPKLDDRPIKVEEKTRKQEENPIKVDVNQTKPEENRSKLEENRSKPEENRSKPKENKTKPPKKISLFDSDDDEPNSLFKTKPFNIKPTENKPAEVKKTKNTKLFDSDSEDDLFKKKPNVKENVKVLKKSLFDDNEEDIFGAKPKTQLENKPEQSASREKNEEKKEKSKPIFEDPLSLFGDDDDE